MRTSCYLSLLAMLALGACAGQPVEPRYFLLRAEAPENSRSMAVNADFALSRVMIAPYIAQRGLLLEVAPGEIRAARHHLWAEPLQDGVYAMLLEGISAAAAQDLLPATAGATPAGVVVRIDQFHGTAEGDALLVAQWWVERDGAVEDARLFVQREPLRREGYAALAQAQRELLVQLAQAIGTALSAEAR